METPAILQGTCAGDVGMGHWARADWEPPGGWSDSGFRVLEFMADTCVQEGICIGAITSKAGQGWVVGEEGLPTDGHPPRPHGDNPVPAERRDPRQGGVGCCPVPTG